MTQRGKSGTPVSRRELLAHIDKWQDVLRLRDWDIRLRMVGTKWRKFGDVKVDWDDKKALVLVNRKPYSNRDVNLEELVVHELLHLKLHAMDQMMLDLLDSLYGEDRDDPKRQFAETQFMTVLEQTVEDLTKALLAADGSGKPLSFDRIERDLQRERRTR